MSARRLWQIGGSLVVVAILVLGWFAAVSPVLAEATQNELDRAAVAEQNAVHEATLASLKAEYQNIDELRLQLDEFAAAIPADTAMPALVRDIAAAAAASGVVISAIRSEDAVDFLPASAAPVEPAAPPADAAEEGDDAASTETDAAASDTGADPTASGDPSAGIVDVDPADLALVGSGQFVTVPITIEFVGEPEQLLTMASALQSMNRVFLVTTFKIEGTQVPPRATVSGLAYVLLDKDGVLTAEDDAAADQPTPNPTETPTP